MEVLLMMCRKKVPFGLALYRGGNAKLMCRSDIYSVTIDAINPDPNEPYPVQCRLQVKGSGGAVMPVSYTLDGRVMVDEDDSWDLMLEININITELWVNLMILPGSDTPYPSPGYPTKYLAERAASESELSLLTTIKLWDSDQGVCNERESHRA
jgi:hypothetical protein